MRKSEKDKKYQGDKSMFLKLLKRTNIQKSVLNSAADYETRM